MTDLFIGMPVYNGEKFIAEAIESIINQKYLNWNLTISDNASTDNTSKICKKYVKIDKRIKYVKQINNIGGGENFKFLLNSADTKYFMWAACDDVWEPMFIEECMKVHIANPRVSLVFTNILATDSKGKQYRTVPSFNKYSGKATVKTVYKYIMDAEFNGKANLIYGIYKKNVLNDIIHLLNSNWGSDMCLNLAALVRGGIEIVDKVLFKKKNPDAIHNIFYNDNIKLRNQIKLNHFNQYYINILNSTFKTKFFVLVFFLMTYRYLELIIFKLFFIINNFFSTTYKSIKRIFFYSIKNKNQYYKKSYSQSGEDLIIDFIFKVRGLENPTYLDIGAHHPFYLSNTAFFYKKGCSGMNIEPNPVLYSQFIKYRKKDINLNIGVAADNGIMNFYLISPDTMSTFSKTEANRLVDEYNFKIVDTIEVEVKGINSILNQYFDGVFPHFLSIDVEGLDLDILKTIDFHKSYPLVICIETISYSEKGHGIKDKIIINYLEKNNYIVFADTNINTIFVRKDFWMRD